MSKIDSLGIREWLVPPVLLPIFFGLLIVAAIIIQSWSPSADPRHRLKQTASCTEPSITAPTTATAHFVV
jgi:hypothetical protein